MHKFIQVFEHEKLKVGQKGFSERHLELLDKFRGDKEDDDFNYYSLIHNGIKFKQFVGVLCVGNLQIEVLPKADRYDTESGYGVWHSRLLQMLKSVYKLKINTTQQANQGIRKSQILDIFIQKFLDEVEALMHKGLIKTYRREEGNLPALKGLLMMSKHIAKNFIHKERFYVNYTTYDRNHTCNRIIYKALKTIPDLTDSSFTKSRAITLQFEFPELNPIEISEETFATIAYDRKNESYRECIELARLLLLHYMPNLSNSRHEKVLALMFDMNKLWEEYVFVKLRKHLSSEYTVTAQNRKVFWKGGSGNKIVKPDIVIQKAGECIAILDTKWKCPHDDKPSDADLKQMFVYHKYWRTPYTALLYPGNSEKVLGRFENPDGYCLNCSMEYLPIEGIEEKLKGIIPASS